MVNFTSIRRVMACEKYEGNLGQLVRKVSPFENSTALSIEEKIQLALQAAKGLEFVHLHELVHKDIKPINFVVRFEKGKWICKLTDFGFSKEKVEGGSHCPPTNRLGTRDWGIAPELLNKEQDTNSPINFSWKCDVWAMGIVIHFIFTDGHHPYGKDVAQRLNNIRDYRPLTEGQEALQQISHEQLRVDDLVAQMIQENPDQRPEMKKVVETIKQWQAKPFFK